MNETNTIMVCVQIGKKVISKAPFLVGPISPRKRAQMQAEEAAVEGFWGGAPPVFFFFGGGTRKTWRFKPLSTSFFLNYQQLCGTKSFGRPDPCATPLFQKQEAEVPAKKKKKCLGVTSSLGVAQLWETN